MTKRSRLRLSRRAFLRGSTVGLVGGAVAGSVAGRTEEAASVGKMGLKFEDIVTVTLKVNGVEHRLALEPRVTLLDALRERLALTGTKKGCNYGECGACTVHVDDKRVNACLVLAAAVDGKEVVTIEGLARNGELHPMQQAFIEHDAFQCGYCTPGQIMSAVALIEEGHASSPEEIREWMSGNICRCAAYPQIVAAIEDVAKRRK
jgi:xanthine dehydrogenase YagT iron-sulfur-binding subunit